MQWPYSGEATFSVPRPSRSWNQGDLQASNNTLVFPGVDGAILRLDFEASSAGEVMGHFRVVKKGISNLIQTRFNY